MPSLRELQRSFAGAVFAGDGAPADFAVDGAIRGADRIAIYRNAMFANYRKALGATYAVVLRLVGAPFFNTAVDAYVRAHASTCGDLNVYGDAFGEFLAGYPYAANLPYLPDVARLEWAIDEAQRAGDVVHEPEGVLAALAAVPPERLTDVELRLGPSCRLVASEYPILRLWQVNQPAHEGDDTVDLGAGGDALLVRRDAAGVTLRQLPPGEFAFLETLAGRAPLGAALATARAADSAFDLGEALRAHIAGGTIVARMIFPSPRPGGGGSG
jgi:hypothetical protein